jgi:EAL domain-containing protein (putative c-di-GMP-specific phosphodiesterase class I)
MQRFCAKSGNLRTASLSDALGHMMTDTVEAVNYIKEVSKSQSFDLVFMPICDLRGGMVHHFEVLTRFTDPRYSQTPYHLISRAEEVGVVADFDLAVCRKAAAIVLGDSLGRHLPTVAVNLSGASIADAAFVKSLHRLLDEDPGLAGRLMFEITESAQIEDLPGVNVAIQELRERGFKVCLDDFGAGAASFDYLNMLDVDIVKFDGPVVRRACSTPKGNELLGAMAEMCTKMSVSTIAEMVEDKKMANQIFYCGIDFGQGWHFGKPDADPMSFAERFVDG